MRFVRGAGKAKCPWLFDFNNRYSLSQISVRGGREGITAKGGTMTETAHSGQAQSNHIAICMNCFTTGGPGKEHGTNKPPPTGRPQEWSKGNTTHPTTSQNPPRWHPSWLSDDCTTKKDSESECLAKDSAETNPITIKPATANHLAEQSSWVPRRPLPIKSLALSACVSPETIHFRMLDKSLIWALERVGSPSCNKTMEDFKSRTS